MKQYEAPAGAKNSLSDKVILTNTKSLIKPIGKIELCLMTFLVVGSKGLRAFDVHVQSEILAKLLENSGKYWTSCLSSDVSKLRRLHGIDIHNRSELYPSQHGHTTYFKRYWLPDRTQAIRALEVINRLRIKRGAAKLTAAERKSLLLKYPLPH